ncbi:MAG: hypothetical protein KGI75_00180 [Rhizobiaceae bacterium]|nr:hypothetical protein [Rhizobiaceae bacterium]
MPKALKSAGWRVFTKWERGDLSRLPSSDICVSLSKDLKSRSKETMARLMILALLVSMSAGHAIADDDAVANAKTLCRAVDTTISVSPCVYSEEAKTVTVSVAINGGDPQELCHTIETSLAEKSIFFDGGPWRLNLKSPAAGDATIGFCDLPQSSN